MNHLTEHNTFEIIHIYYKNQNRVRMHMLGAMTQQITTICLLLGVQIAGSISKPYSYQHLALKMPFIKY